MNEQHCQELCLGVLSSLQRNQNKDSIINVFDHAESYTTHYLSKKGGGKRLVHEPHEILKDFQNKMLRWLYRIKLREDYYSHLYQFYWKKFWEVKDTYHDCGETFLNRAIIGGIKGKQPRDALELHRSQRKEMSFMFMIDIKNAFPSIPKQAVVDALKNVLMSEIRSKYESALWYQINDYVHPYAQHRKIYYPRFPLTSSKNYSAISSHIRNRIKRLISKDERQLFWLYENHYEVRRMIMHIVEPEVEQVATCLARYIAELTTYNGFLPQGAPTSPFLFNLVLSDRKVIEAIKDSVEEHTGTSGTLGSIYADNIFISTFKKPTKPMIAAAIKGLESIEFLKCNYKKNRVFDLRNRGAKALGMVLVGNLRDPDVLKDEFKALEDKIGITVPLSRGLQRASANKRRFIEHSITLPKQKQNQYRGFIYRVTQDSDVSEDDVNKANGYYGHIVSVYGSDISYMPSSLKKVVVDFRSKFHKIT